MRQGLEGMFMNTGLEEICASKLREIRRARGLTLHGFEALSNGAIKAVVLGSYERGTRAISLERLEQIASIYEVPVQYFFGFGSESKSESQMRLIFDLRRIAKRAELPAVLENVKRYLGSIARKRSDWNGEVISLREGDGDCLAIMCDMNISEFRQFLQENRFLFASEVSGQRSL